MSALEKALPYFTMYTAHPCITRTQFLKAKMEKKRI
jgi:hypothetical protein